MALKLAADSSQACFPDEAGINRQEFWGTILMSRTIWLEAVTIAAILGSISSALGRDLTVPERRTIQEAVTHDFKDPESARFRWLPIPDCKSYSACYMGFYCGMVNAKNSFGGYVGHSPFYVFIERDQKG